MKVTEYQLDVSFAGASVQKLPGNMIKMIPPESAKVNIRSYAKFSKDSLIIRRIGEKTSSRPRDLKELRPFRFVPLQPAKDDPHAADNAMRFYGLRFTFVDSSDYRRYAFYKVISCQNPPILPFDGGDVGVLGGANDEKLNFLLQIPNAVIDHQKLLYASFPEKEYLSKTA